jgi:hypothetical protein
VSDEATRPLVSSRAAKTAIDCDGGPASDAGRRSVCHALDHGEIVPLRNRSGSFTTLHLGAREKRYEQNRMPRLILYDDHKICVVSVTLFSQLPNCVLGIGKCGLNIRQIGANRIVLDDPVSSAYREEELPH